MLGQFKLDKHQLQPNSENTTTINQTFIKQSIELPLEITLPQKATPIFAQAHSFAYADLKAYQTDVKQREQNF